jgi:hypothetical protein
MNEITSPTYFLAISQAEGCAVHHFHTVSATFTMPGTAGPKASTEWSPRRPLGTPPPRERHQYFLPGFKTFPVWLQPAFIYIFWDKVLLRLASNSPISCLSLPSGWDYRPTSLCLTQPTFKVLCLQQPSTQSIPVHQTCPMHTIPFFQLERPLCTSLLAWWDSASTSQTMNPAGFASYVEHTFQSTVC